MPQSSYAAMAERPTKCVRVPRLERSAAAADHGAMRPGASAANDCPRATPARESTYARALHLACVILGGVAQLAAHLEATEAAVRSWIEGIDEPPSSAFLAAVEVLLLDAEKRSGLAS